MHQLKYYLGAIVTVPLLPILYQQGKRVRSSVPVLPEAQGPQGVAGNASDSKFRLLAIGESTIAGVGVATHQEGFTGTLARELASKLNRQVEWRVYARSGYTARRVTQKILPKIQEKEADLIVVGLGGNDAFTMNSPAKWQAQVRALVGGIRQQFGATPIAFTNMPPIKSFPAFTPLIKLTIGNLVELLGDALAVGCV
jgi:lysophospholipase L1-like esterase